MLPGVAGSADPHHRRKRSFDLVNGCQHVTTLRRSVRHGEAGAAASINHLTPRHIVPSKQRRTFSSKYSSNMPGDLGSIMPTAFPSFMTVVGQSDESIAKEMEEVPMPDTIHSETQIRVTDATLVPAPSHYTDQSLHHRGSVTSMTTASSESSPTTTNSTFDSPLMTDPSPSSSPESANSNPPISPFGGISVGSSHEQTYNGLQQKFPLQAETEKGALLSGNVDAPKNVKNLSLNMSAVIIPRPATAHGFETSQAFSAPTSPLKDTPRTGRRKPTNLTIRTPGFQQLSFARAMDVPPTPSSRPSLHHMQSSPALASLASPSNPPPQGLFLQPPTLGYGNPAPDSDSSSSSVNSALPELKEEDEFHPQRSQETQEKGYPKGPVLIYDSGVYLYLEPTAEEASNFDTVINVAKEIKTPFESETCNLEEPQTAISEPQTAISEISFKSAWEWPRPSEITTPTTPRPSSFDQKKQPEYLHIPWDHNSEILQDLYSLCRIIDERVAEGKKVLIHCQLGVSRSASLVIAYGLFKGYQPDFHSMYMSVKQRSQWVGPNMSLIYQLTDFRSKVVKDVYGDHVYQPSPNWWKIKSASSTPVLDTPVAKQSSWREDVENSENAKTPVARSKSASHYTVTNPTQPRLNKILPPVPLFPKNEAVDILGTPARLRQILGGIAAPAAPVQEAKAEPELVLRSHSPARSISPRPLPFRERFDAGPPAQAPLMLSRLPKLGTLAALPPMDLAMQDVPDTPSLFSPRATEFMASPFGITSAGDLALTGGMTPKVTHGFLAPRHESPLPTPSMTDDQIPTTVDPRSPHQQGEGPEILRNIDDFL